MRIPHDELADGFHLEARCQIVDALREGRLVRPSPMELEDEESFAYWLAFPPGLRDWPPLAALRDWLNDEIARSQRDLDALKSGVNAGGVNAGGASEGAANEGAIKGTAPAGRSGSRSRAASGATASRRAR